MTWNVIIIINLMGVERELWGHTQPTVTWLLFDVLVSCHTSQPYDSQPLSLSTNLYSQLTQSHNVMFSKLLLAVVGLSKHKYILQTYIHYILHYTWHIYSPSSVMHAALPT